MGNEDIFVEGSLEAKLNSDGDGTYRDKVLHELRQELSHVNQALNQGVKQEDFALFSSMKIAIEAAEKCVITVWNKSHAKY